jgi:hypothetical protein
MSTTAPFSPRPVTWTDELGEHHGIAIGEDVDGATRVREYIRHGDRLVPSATLRPGPTPQRFKLDLCSALADGWWGEGSKAVQGRWLREAESLLGELETAGAAVAPSDDGGLVLEWIDSASGVVRTAELVPDGSLFLTDAARHDLDSADLLYDRATLTAFMAGGPLPVALATAA